MCDVKHMSSAEHHTLTGTASHFPSQCRVILSACAILSLAVITVLGDVVYVDKDATGSNDGTSWANAYTNLAYALNQSATGSEFWIAEGTYKPGTATTNFFNIGDNALYGGFVGTETNRGERNWTSAVTVLNGNLGGSSRVRQIIRKTSSGAATLDGFTIQEGKGSVSGDCGAGVYWTNGSLNLANCCFTNNSCVNNGGAIYIGHAPGMIAITNCSFTLNHANNRGGAVYFGLNCVKLTDCVFTSNDCAQAGGAAYGGSSIGDTSSVINCAFVNNRTSASGGDGGALHITNGFVELMDSTFVSNRTTSSGDGGAVYLASACDYLVVSNCTFTTNSSPGGYSGGIYSIAPCLVEVYDSSFTSNASTKRGAAVYIQGSNGKTNTVRNCSFTGNVKGSAYGEHGGAVYCDDGVIDLEACSFRENVAGGSGGGAAIAAGANADGLLISSCSFSGHQSQHMGGAVRYSGASAATFLNASFTSNTVINGQGAGAVYVAGSSGKTNFFSNCGFTGNSGGNGSSLHGGAVQVDDGYVEFSSCGFTNNATGINSTPGNNNSGGAVYLGTGIDNFLFEECVFIGNMATNGEGGAVRADAPGVVSHCIFAGNSGSKGAFSVRGAISFFNNTFASNSALANGGALYLGSGSIAATNCIFRFDQAVGAGNEIYTVSGTLRLGYSLIATNDICKAGGSIYYDAGIINEDPLFADLAGSDFHEKSVGGRWTAGGWVVDTENSPCVDAGHPGMDYSLEPMENGGRINIGAYGNTPQASRTEMEGWIFRIR